MKHILLGICIAISSTAIAQLTPQEAAKHIGDSTTVCGKVYGGVYLDKPPSKLTLLNVGGTYPSAPFTVVIPPTLRDSLAIQPEVKYKDKEMCFTGRIVLFKEKPQMVLARKEQIKTVQ